MEARSLARAIQSEVSERQRDRHLFYKKLFLHPASTHSHGRALSRDILCLRFHIEADFSDTLIAFILVLGVCDGICQSVYMSESVLCSCVTKNYLISKI